MIDERPCPRCGATIHDVVSPRRAGRPRRWCSPRCRRAASEERRAAANGAIGIQYVEVEVEVTLDQHVTAVLASPAACRRVLREIRQMTEGGVLEEARWSSVQTELDHLLPRPGRNLRWGSR